MHESLHFSQFFDLSNFTHKALFDGTFYPWEALDKLEAYLAALPLGQILGEVDPRAYLIKPELITIGKGSRVEAGAYIEGPCVIGENCTVRHGAYIRGTVLAGNNCVIGHTTEIKHSILLNKAQAAHFAYIGNSILGSNTNLGAGTKLANLRLDHGKVKIRAGQIAIPSGQKKLGAIIGDGAQLGCNSVCNPGVLIAKNKHLEPCKAYTGAQL